MQAVGTSITALHKNQTLNAIAILTTIVVGGFTIYYLVQQTKYLRIQIDKHTAENGDKVKKIADSKVPK